MRYTKFLLSTFFILGLISANSQDDLKTTYFYKALKAEDYEKITRYLDSGISVNRVKIVKEKDRVDGRTHRGSVPYHVSQKSRTPLLHALELKKPELVRFLVDRGADVNQSLNVVWYEKCMDCPLNKYQRKPLHRKTINYRPISWAIDWGDLNIIEFLISKGADYNRENKRIKRKGNKKLIDYFIEKGMKLEFTTDDIEFLYKNAFSYPEKKFIHSLVDRGIEVNPKTLYDMLERRDTILLKKALDNGADVNEFYVKNEFQMCLLCKATLMCDMDLIKLLVEDYNAKSDVVCNFYMRGNRKLYNLTPMEIARHKYIGKCKGRNNDIIEYYLWLRK